MTVVEEYCPTMFLNSFLRRFETQKLRSTVRAHVHERDDYVGDRPVEVVFSFYL